MRERDSQRQKLYRAENEAFKGDTLRFMDIGDARLYADRVWSSAYVRRNYPKAVARYPELRIADGRGTRRAFFAPGKGKINLPLWGRRRWILLHEIAHALEKQEERTGLAWHGWEFARRYLDIVRHFLGKEAEAGLKAAFKKHRVKWKAKRQLTPEQLAALRARGHWMQMQMAAKLHSRERIRSIGQD